MTWFHFFQKGDLSGVPEQEVQEPTAPLISQDRVLPDVSVVPVPQQAQQKKSLPPKAKGDDDMRPPQNPTARFQAATAESNFSIWATQGTVTIQPRDPNAPTLVDVLQGTSPDHDVSR